MIGIEHDDLIFRFPEVHDDAEMAIQFRRTLRVPIDAETHLLPPSHRPFPLRHIDGQAVPQDWIDCGGIIMPIYQAEAMYMAFSGGGWIKGYPFAVKIAAGKINAVSGKPWKEELDPSEEDYIVVPRQPRLYGYCIAKSLIRQFVAMRLGAGYSVEEQLTGKAEHGGLQIVAYPMKADRYEHTIRNRYEELTGWLAGWSVLPFSPPQSPPPYFRGPRPIKMCLAAGGRMKQPIYRDPYGIDAWDQTVEPKQRRCFVALANAVEWQEMTGERPPHAPPTAADYAEVGLPWLDIYAEDDQTRAGSRALALADNVAEVAGKKGEEPPASDGR
jgi:hypothetical protein